MNISVAIPFYNARQTLLDAVRSVFAQSFTDWELILLNDGSFDGSLQIAQRIQDPRVRLVSDGVNKGLSARLNEIAALAGGKYLARMDADDLMHPRRLERQLKFLECNPQIDLVDTATYTIDENNNPLGIRGDQPLNCNPSAVLQSGLLSHPTVMGRTTWFRQHPYDPVFVRAEDRELWTRVCGVTRFGRLQEPLFFYRESPAGNLTNYLGSSRTVRRILRQYGPPIVGTYGTAVLIAKSYMKSLLYWMCTKLGVQDRLIKKRSRRLEAAEIEAATAARGQILATSVPGLSRADCVHGGGDHCDHYTSQLTC